MHLHILINANGCNLDQMTLIQNNNNLRILVPPNEENYKILLKDKQGYRETRYIMFLYEIS